MLPTTNAFYITKTHIILVLTHTHTRMRVYMYAADSEIPKMIYSNHHFLLILLKKGTNL